MPNALLHRAQPKPEEIATDFSARPVRSGEAGRSASSFIYLVDISRHAITTLRNYQDLAHDNFQIIRIHID